MILALASITAGNVSGSEALRVSLLDDPVPQTELTGALREAGCSTASCEALLRVIVVHNRSIRYDRSQFGIADEGWYDFSSPEALLSSMPYPFFETPVTSDEIVQHTLPCFDIAALLLRDLAPSTFTPSLWPTGSGLLFPDGYSDADGPSLASLPGEVYPLNGYQYLTGQQTRSAQENGIIIGFRALRRLLRSESSDAGVAKENVRQKLSDLRSKGLDLDGRLKPLAVHYVRTDRGFYGGEHLGLLVERGARCYFLEKNGASGPFVCVQTDSHRPIIDYVARHYSRAFATQPELVDSIMVITLGSDIVCYMDFSRVLKGSVRDIILRPSLLSAARCAATWPIKWQFQSCH